MDIVDNNFSHLSTVQWCGIRLQNNTARFLKLYLLLITLLTLGGGIFHGLEFHHAKDQINEMKYRHEEDKQEIFNILSANGCFENDDDVIDLYNQLRNYSGGFNESNFINVWTVPRSVMFAFTIISTIGYGNNSPATKGGQWFVIFYGLIGIPITAMCLASVAERVLYFFHWTTVVGKDKAEKAFNEIDADGSGEIDEQEFKAALKRLKYNLSQEEFENLWNSVEKSENGFLDREKFRIVLESLKADVTEITHEANKIRVTIVGLTIWIIFGVIVFSRTENWRVFETTYFLFVTLTTIGLGDVTPSSRFGNIFLIVFAIVGLGLFAALLALLQKFYENAESRRKQYSQKKKKFKRDIKKIQQLPIVASFTKKELRKFAKNTKEFAPHENIIEEGADLEAFYILLTGCAIVSNTDSAETQFVRAPALLLESTLQNNPNMSVADATVSTVESSQVLTLPRRDWEAITNSQDVYTSFE